MKTQSAKSGYFFTYKKYGLRGVLNIVTNKSENNRLLKIILNFDRKYLGIFAAMSGVSSIFDGIGKDNSTAQINKLTEKLNLRLDVFNSFQNNRIDNRKSLLIYGINHNAYFEPFFLLPLLKQQNIKYVANRFYYFLGKGFKIYTFPVIARAFNKKSLNPIVNFFSIGKRFCEFEGFSENERRAMNTESLKNCAQTLESGGVVVIFPGGGGSELIKWRGGLSRIMVDVAKEKRQEVTLLPVYFSSMGKLKTIIRLCRAYKNKALKPSRVGIYFGKEKKLSEIYAMFGEGVREYEILDYLKKDAFSQFGLKEFPLKNYLHPKHYPKAFSIGLRFATKIALQIIPFGHLIRS